MVTKNEIEAVTKLPPQKRYEYLLKRIADFEEVWTLHNDEDGYALNEEDDGSQFFPIWPFKEFSDLWISGEFSNFLSKSVSIYDFKEKILKKLQENNIGILAFPIQRGRGKMLDISEFASDLDAELEQYE